MEALALHLVRPIVQHPDAVSVQVMEGDAAVVLEVVVHPDDQDVVRGESNKTLRAINNILSAAAGRRKATLDLVDAHASGEEE